MDIRDALRLAHELIALHRLDGWGVELDNAKTRAGVCRYRERVIGLSEPLTRLHTQPEVRDTILHEIAHALAGPQAKHGPGWRQVAVSIGCSGRRCVDEGAGRIDGAWVGTCPAGHRTSRHRRPTRVMTCARCSPLFRLEHLLSWTHHGGAALMHPNYAAELESLRLGTPSPTQLPVGAAVRITVPGPYAGRPGRIVSRGRTRFHVRCGEVVVTVPFAGVEGTAPRMVR